MQGDILNKLKALQSIEPSEAWKTAEKGKLMERISAFDVLEDIAFQEREIYPEKQRFAFPALLQTRFALTLASLLIILTSGIMTVRASQSSLPGDKLYAVKRVSEKVQVAVASPEDKPRIEIEQAGKRLEELAQVSQTGTDEEKNRQVEELMAQFQAQVDSANAHLEELNEKGKTDTTVKVADVAKIVNEQSGKFTQVLKEAAQTLPPQVQEQMAVQVADATVTAQKTNFKALLVMVENPGEAPMPAEEMAAKVQSAVDETAAKVNVITQQTNSTAPASGQCSQEITPAPDTPQLAPQEGTCPIGGDPSAGKAEEAQKEIEKAKENLKNNNLADTLKSVVAATEIASQVSVVAVAEPAPALPESSIGTPGEMQVTP